MIKKSMFTLIAVCAFTLANAQQVAVFSDCNYTGRQGYLPAGRYYSYQMKVPNDRLSSLQVPYGMKITVYEHDNFQGRSKTYYGDMPCLETDWRNMASSLIVENDLNQQGGQNDYVVFYADCYQRGVSQTLRPGTYTGAQLGSLKYNISSFTISGNLRIKLYPNNEYASGNAITHEASVYCLPASQNDKTGSLVIEYIPGMQSGGNTGNVDDYATFYSECDFRGNALRIMPGNYTGAKLGLLKNNIASVQVPATLRVKAYSSENMFGSSSLITDDVTCLDNSLRNRIASLVVEYRNGNGNAQQGGNEQVIIYVDANYQGQSAPLLPGNYATMAAAGNFPSKAVSSVYVPQGYRVVLYELENFGGKSYTLTSSLSSFLWSRWNDRTASIAVHKDR
jgi:hypothetical protein